MMEEKVNKYETKLEKLTFCRILVVLICEILFEFSFGLVFFVFSEYEGYYSEDCVNLLFWTKTIWKLYLAEFTVAFLCFLIGILSLLCYKKTLTKVYISFNNFFKSLIFLASLAILTIVTIVYQENEKCEKLGEMTLVWLILHFVLLGFACIAGCAIIVVTLMLYKSNSYSKEIGDTNFNDYLFKK